MTTTTLPKPEGSTPASSKPLRRLFIFLWQGLDRHQLNLTGLAVAGLVGAKLASLVVPWLLGRLVGVAAERVGDLFAVMGGLIAAYVLARFIQVVLTELKDSVFVNVVQHLIRRLARRIFAHLHSLPLAFHHSRQTGGLAVQIERGTKGIEFIVSSLAFNFVPTQLELIAVCLIFWGLYGWTYAAVTAVTILLYGIFTVLVSSWRIQFRRRLNETNERSNTQAVDSLLNHETVKLFSAEEREVSRYDTSLGKYERAARQSQWTLSLLNLGQALIITAGLAVLLLLAANDTANGNLDAGDLATLNAYLLQMFFPLGFLGTVYRIVSQAITDIEKSFALLDEPSSTPDMPGAAPLQPGPGQIEFSAVSLQLGGRQILDNVSFAIPANAHYAIVGETGSGKTTLARLLARLLDPDTGTVTIDGQDLREVTQRSVRTAMAFVSQDVIMFNDTLQHNLCFGKPDASVAELTTALATAKLDDFITRLPDGLATEVGERGLKLSGGERQRLAIARALLLNPRILVMDEATSSLDAPTEARIKAAMEQATAGRTTLLIAHRLATVTACDQIIVLAEGKIIEQGTHTQLLEQDGHYAQSWHMQSQQKR